MISCALQVLFANNPKFAKLSYNGFLEKTGLKDDSFSDQTFLNNKNAFKIISKIKNHDTREKLRNCGVSVVVKFLRISERTDFEALIKKFLSGPAVSRSNAEEYVNSIFPTKKLSVRPKVAKSGSIAPQAKSTKVDYPNRFGYGGTAVSVLPSEKAMQENDIEELPNNEANPDIVLEEANGYSRKSLGVRIDIVGHGQIDAEKIEASFESMREYLSLFVERYAEGEPEWNNIEKLMNYLKSHLDNKSQCCVPEKQDRLARGKLICKIGRQIKWATDVKNTRKSKSRKYSRRRRYRTTFRIRCASMESTIRRITAGRQNTAVWTPRAYKGFESSSARTRD